MCVQNFVTKPLVVAKIITHAMAVDLAFKARFYLLLECCSQNNKSAGSLFGHLFLLWASLWVSN